MYSSNKAMPDLSDLRCQTEKTAIDNHERVIFYRLAAKQVFYDHSKQLIYFADIDETPVVSLLESLCQHGNRRFILEILFLDVNYYFFAGYRVHITHDWVNPLLVALRLQGIDIDRQLPTANIENQETPWFISKPLRHAR